MSNKSGNSILIILALIFGFFLWLSKSSEKEKSNSEKELFPENKPKKNRIKVITLIFIFVGLFFQVAGFFTDKADKNQFLLKIFASNYVKAKEGYETVLQREKLYQNKHLSFFKKFLIPDDEGFAELSEIGSDLILNEAKRNPQNNNIRLPSKLVISSIRTGSGTTISGEHSGNISFACDKYCPKEGLEISMKEIEGKLENLRNNSLFKWAFLTFCIGFVIQIISLWFNQKN